MFRGRDILPRNNKKTEVGYIDRNASNTTTRRARMKKIASKILISILFLAGLSLLLYPLVANEWNNYRQKR